MNDTVQSLVAYCRENGRICPQPMQWNAFYELLFHKGRVGLGSEPPPPLILAAWYDTPALFKMHRLAEHIEWADKHRCLDAASNYLRSIQEKDWVCLGE